MSGLDEKEGAGGLEQRERLDAFLERLERMSAEGRVRASRHSFTSWELYVWATHYPDEVPTVNGECEWIALRLADVD